MNSFRLVALASAAAIALSGCQTAPTRQAASGGCKPLPGTEQHNSNTTNAVIGGAIGAVAGGLIGRSAAGSKTRGTRNGALLGALAGALAGSQYNKMIGLEEQPDGSVKMNIPGAVLFATGKADISPAFMQTLDQVAGTITEYCGVTALVVGHTDSTGSDKINVPLSQERAVAVVNYLATRGVDRARLNAQGAGSSQPIATNDTADGRQQNRRVEIFIRPPQG